MSDWDKFEQAENAAPKTALAEALIQAKQKLDEAEAEYKRLCDEAVSRVPEDFGDHIIDTPTSVITVSRGSRYEWDQTVLSSLFESGVKKPDFVKSHLTIDKKRFDRMAEEDRAPLLPALTRKPGSVSVKVTLKGDES
jgi:hypothetical protein